MQAVEGSNEHGHTFNRTTTCTVSSQFILELHGTRLGTSWMAAFFFKNERKITTGRGFFFLFFCAHFFTGGLPADGITAMVVKECRLLSIALGCLWRLSSRGATCSRRCMHK